LPRVAATVCFLITERALSLGGHTNCAWVLLYIERWLKAPVQMEDGSVVPRAAGTPQGGVISPLLANLFLHYAFDAWMSAMGIELIRRSGFDLIVANGTKLNGQFVPLRRDGRRQSHGRNEES
jgi:hypothetical protein